VKNKNSEIQCVKCGKCLAICGAYKNKLVEHFSPRGRIVIQHSASFDSEHYAWVYCLGCLECEDFCPYNSSPLQVEKIPFVWENCETLQKGFFLNDLFNLIYKFSEFGDGYKKWIGLEVSDALVFAWLFKRGIEACFNGIEIDVHYTTGHIYNPFSSLEIPLREPEIKIIWDKLLRRIG